MRPFPTILTFLALALVGFLLLPQLSIRWQPSPGKGTLSVEYSWPGAGPDAVESQVTAPLEAALALVTGIDNINSVSKTGGGYVTVTLDEAADPDFIRFRVASQIRRLYPVLPEGVSYPSLTYDNPEVRERQRPVQVYALSGPDSPTELYRFAQEQLAPRLSLVPGLNRLEVSGGNRMHWRILLDPDRVAVAGLTRNAVAAELRRFVDRSGLGFVRDGPDRLFVYQAAGLPQLSERDWRAIPINGGPASRQLRLGDLGEVQWVPLPATGFYRINGENSIRLLAYPTADANQLGLARELGTRVRALKNLPPGYQLRLEQDNTEYLREELAKTRRRTALSLGVLLVFVLLAYRNFRRLATVMISLTVNLGLAFALYWLLGVELNLYAFAGIAVSFGIMIDNIIIVLDGLKNSSAKRLLPPILGATLTTLAGLSVIYFLDDDLRAQLFELARVMGINLGTSVLVAIAFVPALEHQGSHQLGASTRESGRRGAGAKFFQRAYVRTLEVLLRFRPAVLVAIILAFGLPVWWLPNQVEGWDLYNRTLGSDRYRQEIRPVVNKVLGGSFRLFTYYVFEGSGYRPPEETQLYVSAVLPDGARVEQLNGVMRQVEGYLSGFGGRIDRYTTQVSSGQLARMTISFPPAGNRGFPYLLKNRLVAYATNFGGVKWNIYGVGQGFNNSSAGRPVNFNVILKGYAQAGLEQHSKRLAELLLQHPRVQEVNTDANLNWWEKDRYEFLLRYRPASMTTLGLPQATVREALSWFDVNTRPAFYLQDGTPVAIGAQAAGQYDRWRLENWSVPVDSQRVSFAQIGSIDRRRVAQALHKEDQQYLRQIAFEYLGSPRFGNRHLAACLDTLRAELPLGYTIERRGYSFQREAETFSGLMALAIALIFFICALLFENLRQAFHIILLIPISCIGIFLTFYLFNVRLDQGGYVSFLLVTGLVVNGLILVVNEYNHLRKNTAGKRESELYALALGRKLLPIALTVVSTAAGLFPFLLGGNDDVFWHGLAAGTIGGLAFSLPVIALVSPVFFLRKN